MPKKKAKSQSKKTNANKNILTNKFSDLDPAKLTELKEAFQLLDLDHDGIISVPDLENTYKNLGKKQPQASLQAMVDEALGPINMSIFINMLADRMKGSSPEQTLLDAFRVFDDDNSGRINVDELSKILTTQADRFKAEEMKELISLLDVDEDKKIDYKQLVQIMTHPSSEEETCYSEVSEETPKLRSKPLAKADKDMNWRKK